MSINCDVLLDRLQQRSTEVVQLERSLLERDDECRATENYFQWFYDQVKAGARPIPEVGPKIWLGGFAPRIQEEIENEIQEALDKDLEWIKEEKRKSVELDRKFNRSKVRTRKYISKIQEKMQKFQEELDEIKGKTPPVKLQYNNLLQIKRKLCWESGEIRDLLKQARKQRRDIDEMVAKLEPKLSKYLL